MAPSAADALVDVSPPLRITLDELRAMEERGERVVLGDVRKDAAYYEEGFKAAGAVRLDPDDPVRDAQWEELPPDVAIVVYCA